MLKTVEDVEKFVYRSLNKFRELGREGYDFEVRNPEYARDILEGVGSPDKGMESVIVAGSKGKGTVARMMGTLLGKSGKVVGLYNSPHLVHFNERIRVDGKSISDEDFVRLGNIVKDRVDELEGEIPEDVYIGPGGILLAIAVLYFKEKRVDIAVFEVGLGGRYDEVNVLDNKWAVVTPILREHLDRIGPTLYDVVDNKLDIVKQGTDKVFIGKQTMESLAFIRDILNEKMVISYLYGKHFKASDVRVFENRTVFTLASENRKYSGLSIPLYGAFQAENAALAVRAVEDILSKELNGVVVRESFKNIIWPGRCEIINYDPMVVVDGTIHRSSAIYLKEWLGKYGEFDEISVILSISSDMDYKGVIEEVSTVADRLVTTLPDFVVKDYPEDINEFSREWVEEVHSTSNLEDALGIANTAGTDLILILGTLHLVGEAKRLWGHSRELEDLGK